MYNPEKISTLDKILHEKGPDNLVKEFHELVTAQKNTAVKYLNDENLSFPCLYLIIPEIISQKLFNALSIRNITALRICAKFKKDKNLSAMLEQIQKPQTDISQQVLRWIFKTGINADGLSNDFDNMLDKAFAMLMISYHDRTLLENAANLIFSRNKRGEYIHDLVWAYFKIRDLGALKLIAEYLKSDNKKDIELASNLLHYSIDKSNPDNTPENNYNNYLSWLDDNKPFLYFTDESFNYSSSPAPCNMDERARYINKGISPNTKNTLTPLTQFELNNLKSFKMLNEREQKILSDFSHKIHKTNPQQWVKWISGSVGEQLKAALKDLEVRNDKD